MAASAPTDSSRFKPRRLVDSTRVDRYTPYLFAISASAILADRSYFDKYSTWFLRFLICSYMLP